MNGGAASIPNGTSLRALSRKGSLIVKVTNAGPHTCNDIRAAQSNHNSHTLGGGRHCGV